VNPILEGLKRGERFPFRLLAEDMETVDAYWEHWWNDQTMTDLTRPYTVSDDDPELVVTDEKSTLDTESYSEFFSKPLRYGLQDPLPRGSQVSRCEYRDSLVSHLVRRGETLSEPKIVFVGGGYGAGKTTILQFLANHRRLPFQITSVVGVDICKDFLPEFHRLRRVADGRASEICQKEAREVSNRLFIKLIEHRRSFAWDSSMSNENETIEKLKVAKDHGYTLELVAVKTSTQTAIRRAMSRARESRRFAHPRYLATSATGFQAAFKSYLPYFDLVMCFENDLDDSSPIEVDSFE